MISLILFRNEFITVSPNSALAAHKFGRTTSVVHTKNDQILYTKKIIFNSEHKLLDKVHEYLVLDLGDCCKKVWSNLMEYDIDYIRSTSEVDKSF